MIKSVKKYLLIPGLFAFCLQSPLEAMKKSKAASAQKNGFACVEHIIEFDNLLSYVQLLQLQVSVSKSQLKDFYGTDNALKSHNEKFSNIHKYVPGARFSIMPGGVTYFLEYIPKTEDGALAVLGYSRRVQEEIVIAHSIEEKTSEEQQGVLERLTSILTEMKQNNRNNNRDCNAYAQMLGEVKFRT